MTRIRILVPEEPVVAGYGNEVQVAQIAACGDNCMLASHLRPGSCPGEPTSCPYADGEYDSPADRDQA